MNNRTFYIAAGILVLLIVIILVIGFTNPDKMPKIMQSGGNDKNDSDAPDTAAASPPNTTPSGSPCPSGVDNYKVLKRGGTCQKEETKLLQKLLNDNITAFVPSLAVDGIFGQKTEKRLYDLMQVREASLMGASLFFNSNPQMAGVSFFTW